MAGKASVENGKKGGRPKGAKSAQTLVKEAVLAEFRNKVMESADVLFNSQLHVATGQTYLYKIEKELQVGPKGGKKYVNSRPKLVTDTWEIEAYLMGKIEEGDMDNDDDPHATYYYLTTEKPDNKAIDSMLDRVFGKSAQIVVTEDKEGNKLPITGIVINPPDGRKDS